MRLASAAVASGNKPLNTMACDDGTVCKASELNNGKPITTPELVSKISRHKALGGNVCFWQTMMTKAAKPAKTERPKAMNGAFKPWAIAYLVSGKVKLKINTPKNARANGSEEWFF